MVGFDPNSTFQEPIPFIPTRSPSQVIITLPPINSRKRKIALIIEEEEEEDRGKI